MAGASGSSKHKGTVAVLGPEIKFGMGHHSKPSVRCCTRSQPGLVRKENAYSTRIRSGNVPPQSRDRRGFESSSARQHRIRSDRLFALRRWVRGRGPFAEIPEATAEISETGAECRQLRHLSQVRIGATPSKEIQQTRQFLIGGGVKRAKERYAWDLRSALTQDFRQFESGCSTGADNRR